MSWHSTLLCIGFCFGVMNQVDETVFNEPRIIVHARNSSCLLLAKLHEFILLASSVDLDEVSSHPMSTYVNLPWIHDEM